VEATGGSKGRASSGSELVVASARDREGGRSSRSFGGWMGGWLMGVIAVSHRVPVAVPVDLAALLLSSRPRARP